MKCGKKAEGTDVFCEECLAVMEKYPVKPDSAVHLPHREPRNTEKKPPRKKELSAELIYQHQRSQIRWLTLTVVFLTVIICLLGALLLQAHGGAVPLPEPF